MNCDTCVYLGLQPIEPNMAVTVCRRNAPGAKGWPVIQFPDTDGCGQHKPKTPAERGTCGNCRHAGDNPISGRTECREQPRPVYTDRHGIVPFAPVVSSDWCSKWEAKP
jgi:hypothetical protein